MRPRDAALSAKLEKTLLSFSANRIRLRGIEEEENRQALVEQMLESIHRIEFVRLIVKRDVSPKRADPNNILFDPLKAAIIHQRNGMLDEACWLIFLFVHLGRSQAGGWRYAREIYGRLGVGPIWSWSQVSTDIQEFRDWLQQNKEVLRRKGSGFGNHRKRESLDGASANGTGAVVASYVNWIGPPRTHQELFGECFAKAKGNRREAFDLLYRSMDLVHRFGRLAKFDYLTMIGKLGIADIEPGVPYLSGSTGPRKGACLLFGTKENAYTLDQNLAELDKELGVGMQVLEDSLCNWQKNPGKFVPFRG